MKSKISHFLATGSLLVLPMFASAQTLQQGTQVGGIFFTLIEFVEDIITTIFPLISVVLVLLFAYQLIMFLVSKENIDKADVMRKRLFNAFIVLLIWFTLFGLLGLVARTFGLRTDGTINRDNIPKVDI